MERSALYVYTHARIFTIRGFEDCAQRGLETTGFFEVDTAGQSSWTVQLTGRLPPAMQRQVRMHKRDRSVKILATLGPASSTVEQIKALHLAGADVFRINMSHGDPDKACGR